MDAVDGFHYLAMTGNIVQNQCKLVRYRESLFLDQTPMLATGIAFQNDWP